MQHGIVWCAHCGRPHGLQETTCFMTGKSIERSMHRSSEKAHPLIGTTIADRYRLVRVIGTGGTATVFEAESLPMKRLVAVKILNGAYSDEQAARLQREAEVISSIQHPNICDGRDFGIAPSVGPYLVTERLFGETLASFRARHRSITLATTVHIMSEVLSALHSAHANSIVHRDLKPRNIFLSDRLGCAPLAKILDFGLAKDLSDEANGPITRPGRALGTPQYMSPEQLCGMPLTPASDLFAAGVITYELLTGEHPFYAPRTVDLQTRILRDDPTPLTTRRPELSALSAVLTRALSRRPDERHSNAAALLTAIQSAAREPQASTERLAFTENLAPDSSGVR